MSKKQGLVLFSGLALSAMLFLLLSVSSAYADEVKWRMSSYIVKMEVKPVGDLDGHVTGPYVRRGLAFFQNNDVAVVKNTGVVDMTKGKGSIVQSEAVYTFEDGSSWVSTFKGSFGPGADGKTVYSITGDFLKGTGRFEGITGKITVTGKLLTPYSEETKGDAFFDAAATYTLPKGRKWEERTH